MYSIPAAHWLPGISTHHWGDLRLWQVEQVVQFIDAQQREEVG